jgi:hypothetical protein
MCQKVEDFEKRKRKLLVSERPRRVFGIGPKSIEWERKEGGRRFEEEENPI